MWGEALTRWTGHAPRQFPAGEWIEWCRHLRGTGFRHRALVSLFAAACFSLSQNTLYTHTHTHILKFISISSPLTRRASGDARRPADAEVCRRGRGGRDGGAFVRPALEFHHRSMSLHRRRLHEPVNRQPRLAFLLFLGVIGPHHRRVLLRRQNWCSAVMRAVQAGNL